MYLFSAIWNRNVYSWDWENQKKKVSQNGNHQNLPIYKHICADTSLAPYALTKKGGMKSKFIKHAYECWKMQVSF